VKKGFVNDPGMEHDQVFTGAISELDIREANLRHDEQTGFQVPIRSSWNEARVLMRGPLTDKKISQYARRGYYSTDLKEARKTLADMRAKRRAKRSGNFDLIDGRMIYRP
jgi:hypothetical protein